MIPVDKRLEEYDKNHCWQYDIRIKNRQEDLNMCGFSEEYVNNLRVKDFDFKCVTDKQEQREMSSFIQRHEWLGTISLYATHWFACYHKDILAGVIIMSMPNAFSKVLGEDTKKYERLISRGACISWSPKNLASSFVMYAIKYMVKNTQYRLFTAYSDPSAKELGTIYQACNFKYLGQFSGSKYMYINPYTGKLVSDRFFRVRSAYKKYAIELNIDWKRDWNKDSKILWENMPDDIEQLLRKHSKEKQLSSKKIKVPSKHKYAMVLGKDKPETKLLKRLFRDNTKEYEYPKIR